MHKLFYSAMIGMMVLALAPSASANEQDSSYYYYYYAEIFQMNALRGMHNYLHAKQDLRGGANDYLRIYHGHLGYSAMIFDAYFGDSMGIKGAYGGFSKDEMGEEVPEWQLGFGVSGGYTRDDYDLSGNVPGFLSETSAYNTELTMLLLGDRFNMGGALSYTDAESDVPGTQNFPYERLSVRLTPTYSILMQETEGFDLDLIGSGALSHVWYDESVGTDDPSSGYVGGGLGLGRTLPVGDVRVSYLYGVTKNLDGDDQVSGESTLDMQQAAIDYSVPLAERFWVTLGASWQRVEDLPTYAEKSDEYYGNASFTYQAGQWRYTVGGYHSLEDDNGDSWSLNGSIAYLW